PTARKSPTPSRPQVRTKSPSPPSPTINKPSSPTGGNNETPSWTRNSRHLIFARSGKLFLLDSVTRQTTALENGLTLNSEPNCSR
ncbi:MAG: hypothetical protein HC904_16035, partial [Blastochloris sp.]|nr:hypothetical protein [Blastochloris sp.]